MYSLTGEYNPLNQQCHPNKLVNQWLNSLALQILADCRGLRVGKELSMRQGWHPDSTRSGQVQEPAIAFIHHTTCFSLNILFLLNCSAFFLNFYMKRHI